MATRVTDAEKDRMRELHDGGMSYRAIGREIGYSHTVVACICDLELDARTKVRTKARIQTPKYKASRKAYEQTPKRKDDRKVHAKTQNSKAVGKAYRQTPKRKAARKAYEQTPKVRAIRKAYRHTVQGRLRQNLRRRLHNAVKNSQKAGSSIRDVGCTIEHLKSYLESKFQPGMTWDNWTHDGWHIDHIKPLASFDLTDREQFKEACHYTNLQPLWAEENLSKGAKLAWEAA